MRSAALLALLLAAGPAAALPSSWSEKPYGVLLVGPDAGTDWQLFVSQVRKAEGRGVPVEAFAGPLESRDLQSALDRLAADRVRKVCVLPVFLHAASPELDQLKYMVGVAKLPSKEFMDLWGMASRVVPRVKTKAALVLGSALGDDPAVSAALADRALEGRRLGRPETVLLLGTGAASDTENAAWDVEAQTLAGRLAKTAGLAGARAWLLRPDSRAKPRQSEESRQGLLGLARSLRRDRVVVLPYLLTQDGSSREWKRTLENPFLRWVDKGLLPSARLARWAVARAAALADQPDEVRFKDAGQALPQAGAFQFH
ncbi:MAG: hypothetical protein KGL53_15980 [Elusimicrobia bacterium]|nr:hypothetical protein [Elusimicrobiota bacterium]